MASENDGADPQSWSRDMLVALIAQLHYDRADVARLSSAAAAAMDIAISEVMTAAEKWLGSQSAASIDLDVGRAPS